jgi:hypothetical protein
MPGSKLKKTPRLLTQEAKKDSQVTAEQHRSPFHCLLRVRSEGGQTIDAHASMIAREGTAILGKVGQGIGSDFRTALNEQIDRGVQTYLFLTTREGWNGPYVTYRCKLRRVHESLEASKKALVPKYYVADSATIKTWFEITSLERLSREEMNQIFVLSSNRPIMSVIASSAAVFRVGVEAASNADTRR